MNINLMSDTYILEPSENPTLTGNFTTLLGMKEPLTCSSTGGSPPAQLEWFLDDGTEAVEIDDETNSTQDVSVLLYTPRKLHNGSDIVCKATQDGGSSYREEKQQLIVLCKYILKYNNHIVTEKTI